MTIGLFLLILLGIVAASVALGVVVAVAIKQPPVVGAGIALMISGVVIAAWALIRVLNTPLNL